MPVINGTSGHDTLADTSGNDTINGLAGNDTIKVGSGGTDVVNGGDGRDSLEFRTATSAVVVDFVAGVAGTTSFTNIEKVVTGDFNDHLTGNAAAQNLAAQGGADTLWGAGGIDTLWGGSGADTFIFREMGTANADVMGDWTSGQDTLLLDGAVMTALGAGGDFTAGDARFWASSTGVAHDADDRIIFNSTTRQIFYDADGNGSGAAQLIATLQTGATLVATDIAVEGGSAGGQVINGGNGGDMLVGTAGNDTMDGGNADDTLRGMAGDDLLSDTGTDQTNGSSDSLEGGAGNDTLRGNLGNDTLTGGTGNDELVGGEHRDTYVFDAAPSAANADVVIGFDTNFDHIVLDANAMAALGSIGDFSTHDPRFHAAAGASTAHDADDRIVYDTSSGRLWYDADGSGGAAAQLIATFQGEGGGAIPTIAASDLFVVNGSASGQAINGTSGDDSIVGTGASDTINGLGGNDTLLGQGGNDRLEGGAGNDSLVGGGGVDALMGGDGDDVLLGRDGSFDRGGLPMETLDGGLGNDIFHVDSDDDVLLDAGGVDELVVYNMSWTLGAGFENLVIANGESETGFTGIGNELDNHISATYAGSRLEGRGGNDTLVGGGINTDTLLGGDGNDSLDGDGGNDVLDGGAGDDTLHGGRFDDGRDTLTGGAGVDTFVFGDPHDGLDQITDFASGVDRLQLDGDMFADIGPSGSFSAQDERFYAAAGATSGNDATDRVIYNTTTGEIFYDDDGSGAGTSVLVGTLPALAASDIFVVNGDTQGQVINGTQGNDDLRGGTGNDTISGLGGNDTLHGRGGNDSVDGGAGNDWVSGDRGADYLAGGEGDDTIFGDNDGFADTLDGGSGNDLYVVWSESIVADAGGIDMVDAYDMDWTLAAGFENLRLNSNTGGGEFRQVGTGNELDNVMDAGWEATLYGLGGNDVLTVFNGFENILDGGSGRDTLNGASNADDQFFFTVAPGSENADQVNGFVSGRDELHLDNAAYGDLGASGAFSAGDARFAANSTGTAQDASDRVIYNTSTGELWFDADGTGASAAQLIATLQGAPELEATDIMVENGTDPDGQVINGTSGNDSLTGTDGDDTMDAFGGNDTIDARGGNDSLAGGSGADSLLGGDGNDTLNGNWFGPSEQGEADVDTMEGGLGDDLYHVDNPNDVLSDAGGTDTVRATDMNWTLGAGFENLIIGNDFSESGVHAVGNDLDNRISVTYAGSTLEGHGGNDTLLGADGQNGNRLFGGDGNDSVAGGSLGDLLDGGAGNDTLAGWGSDGGGDDYRFSAAPGAANADQLLHFNSEDDRIQLDGSVHAGVGFNGRFAEDDGRFHSAAGASAGHDADDRVVYDTSTGNLWYDADGSGAGAAQLIATLPVGAALVAANIEVVNASGLVIQGTAGNDSLTGTTSDDTINGGAGDDTLDGSGGADSMTGGAGDDVYFVDNEGDRVLELENGGIDEVRPDVWHSYTLPDWVENLTLTAANVHEGHGNALDNVLTDAIGGRLLFGADGNDTLIGGAGENALWGEGGNDSIVGGAHRDHMVGGAGNDSLSGGDGDDDMWMGFVHAGASGYGVDVLDGGAGFDSVGFSETPSQSALTLDLQAGTFSNGAGSGTLVNIEGVFATDADDHLTGDDQANHFVGSGGNDTLDGRGGNDTLEGGLGADRLVFSVAPGAANADAIWFFETGGTDRLVLDGNAHANAGASGIFAASDARFAANSTGMAQDASDRVIFNTGTGEIWYDADGSGAGARQLIATLQGDHRDLAAIDIEIINGSAPSGQVINGTSGADTLTDTAGNDTINGLAGNDDINGGHGGTDVVNGGDGRDSLQFMTATSAVVVDFAAGTVTGGGSGTTSFTNIEKVVTSDFNDQITGNASAQNLSARAGADTLAGAGGVDTLWGGSGADTFIFRETGTANADTIGDWTSGSDELALDNAAMGALGADGAFVAGDARFWASSTGTAHDANDRVIYNSTTRQIFYDADGNGSGAAQLIATMQAGATVVATDISVI
jgi:Ca2+-binding RTX toxin-like protein